jgi:hypothetical protein
MEGEEVLFALCRLASMVSDTFQRRFTTFEILKRLCGTHLARLNVKRSKWTTDFYKTKRYLL